MSTKKKHTIPVLDHNDRFLSNTTPAKARMMLRDGKATIFNDNPFMIKKNGELKGNMPNKRKTKARVDFITNFTKYFAKEAEVYIQNLGSTNISLTFKYEGEDIYVSVPKTRKPLNLTQYVPFDGIKNSPAFRKMINRNPPIIRLMDEKEYLAYYNDLSEKYGTEPVDEMRKAQDVFDALMGKRAPSSQELKQEMEEQLTAKEEALLNAQEPNSKVVGLCAKADKDQKEMRITEREFLEELEVLEGDLTVEDWEYVSTKGVYRKVKKFASDQVDAMTSSDEE